MNVFNSLAPVFAIIALGAILKKSQFLTEENLRGINRLTYWVGLPCLLFYKIATASYTDGEASRTFFVLCLSTSASIALGYLVAWILRIPSKSTGTFVQAAFRGNLAFIGLPAVIYSSSGILGTDAAAIETLAVLVIAPMVPTYNFLSVFVLLLSRQKLEWQTMRNMLLQVIINPLLLASILALIFLYSNLTLPDAISRTTRVIGQMSLALALLSIGGSLMTVKIQDSWTDALTASLIKVGLTPIIGYHIALLFGLGPIENRIALIYLSCPTAAASYVLTGQLGGDEAMAASAVVISTLLAMVSLGIAISVS